MVRWINTNKYSPIGLDIGPRSVQLVQLSTDFSRLIESARWDYLLKENETEAPVDCIVDAIRQARESRNFKGRDVVICLNEQQLFMQNIRVPKIENGSIAQFVQQEAAGRIPFAVDQAEIRYLEAADVRQGDHMLREVILFACERPVLEQALDIVDAAGLNPVAVDVEPSAILRSYASQFKRDEDKYTRAMIVHVGFSCTAVVISEGTNVLFIKYIDIGGRHLDEAVAKHLDMEMAEAHALRRHSGDRRTDIQDEEVTRSVHEATRPVMDQLLQELSMCVRYHSVTFRGRPLVRLVLGGSEASTQILDAVSKRLDMQSELSDPFRRVTTPSLGSRLGQWDVAMGLALRNM